MEGIQIYLVSVERELHDAWQRFCGDLEGFSVHYGSILDLSCDAVVSPANSFGFMDGGVDMGTVARIACELIIHPSAQPSLIGNHTREAA